MNKSKILMRNTDGVLFTIYDDQAKDSKLVDKVISIVLASEDNKNLTVLKDYVPSEEESKKIVGLQLTYLASEWVKNNVSKGDLLKLQVPYESLIDSSLIGCENMRNTLERRLNITQKTLSLSNTNANTDISIKLFLQDLAHSIDNELTEVIRQRSNLVKIKEYIDKIKEDTLTVKQYLTACVVATDDAQ
jgi:hypothetical protein